VAFGLAFFTATASEIHPRTSKSCISCSKNIPDPKSSTSARSSPRGNPKTLRSPAERGQDLRRQTPVGMATISSKYTTSPTSTPLVRPLAAKSIPLGPWQRNSWSGPRTSAAAVQILLLVPRRRLHTPNKGLPGNEGHQRQDVSGATSRQPKSCRAHVSTTPTAIHPRPRSASPPHPQQQNIHHPNHPQAPKQEDFADQPYRGVIHMITGGSSVDFDTKRQKRDHYRSINHVAVTSLVV
jgi:hypothetical protein